MITKACLHCGKPFQTRINRVRYCSTDCYHAARSGKRFGEYEALPPRSHGYRWAGGYFEHILVMERILGRRLKPGEVVHHIDGNHWNNDPANLELKGSHAEHRKAHDKTFRSETHKECTECHRILPSSEFYVSKSWADSWDKRHGKCKECYAPANKESRERRAAGWKRKYTEEQLATMTRKCSRCGVEKPLSAFYPSYDTFRQVPVRQPCISCCAEQYQERKKK